MAPVSDNWALENNPPYPLILRLFLIFVTPLILLLSVRLLRDPFGASSWWPWELSPYDAGFLGVFSLAEASAILIFLIVTRWSPGRLVVPSWFIFTALVGVLSLLNQNLFDLQRREVQIWFAMYLSAPLLAGYFLWWGRGKQPAVPRQLPSGWRKYMRWQALVTGLTGFCLLLAPEAIIPFWPWMLDPFTARIFGIVFVTSAAGAYLLWRAVAPLEGLAYALPQTILGFGAVITFLAINASLQPDASYSAWTLLWLLAFTFLGGIGALLLWITYFGRRSR